MTKAKKICSVLICFIAIISTLCVSAIPASAATRGNSRSATITVNTKANYWYPGASSITLKQDKQTFTFEKLFGNGQKAKKGYYGCYDINVYNVTKNKTKTVFWNGGQTKKIELDPNCTYRITVSYNSLKSNIFTKAPLGYSLEKTSSPSWRVSSSWKIASYY